MDEPPTRPVTVMLDARFRPALKGGDRYRYELLRALDEIPDLQITPVTLRASRDLMDARVSIETGISSNAHPQAELFEHLGLPWKIARTRPDVYHGTFHSLPLWSRRRTRTVLTVHDTALHDRPELFSDRFRRLALPQFARSVASADHIICVTETTRHRLEELFPTTAERTSVILNGVSAAFHPRAPDAVEAKLRDLGVPTPYVLFVGNLEPKKNVPRLMAAFERLHDLPHHLVLVGTRPDGTRSDELETDSTRVHRMGFVEETDLPWLYAGAALVAYPSTYEGFGMPVLEGMASGTPVLTSDTSCLPEVAGGAAILVDPLEVEQIATGLRIALTDDTWRADARRAGLARAAALTWQANAAATAQVYRGLR